jgi:hypothetical protein
LPGLFATNYFGPRYVELIGEDRLMTAPAADVRKLGEGVLMRVVADPQDWAQPEAQEAYSNIARHLGRRLFFARRRPLMGFAAPVWPSEINRR